ncbi:unnamed protein product [Arabidopsis arenosa]|uniref:Uncharacterized protein n=1 Tax=Arabidopsis arenosa TaxID=38785 RepID=A0A8S2A850_ARAAE|nr:unnamed protein product [Arabidopsis arenosa]
MNKQQESLLKKVTDTRERIMKEIEEVTEKISTVKTVTIISHVVFAAAGVIYTAGCIALMCTGVGAGLGAVGALGIPVLAVQWVGVNYVLNDSLEALQKQLKALNIVKSIPPKIEANASLLLLWDTNNRSTTYQWGGQRRQHRRSSHQLTNTNISCSIGYPRFDGGDPTEWLSKLKQYFTLHEIPSEQRVSFASYHLSGRNPMVAGETCKHE